MTQHIEVLPDKTALVQRSTALIVEKIQTAIAQRGTCTIALSGVALLNPFTRPLLAMTYPGTRLHIFWGDERYVPPDHPDSNQRMAREAWLDQVALPRGTFIRCPPVAKTQKPMQTATTSN